MKYKLNGQWYEIAVPSYDSLPVGAIVSYAGENIPTGYMLCNGQSLLRTEYPDLFNAIGTTYGSVDSTHFNLPNIKGRVLVGRDSTQTEFNALGKTGGSKTHNHTLENGYAGIGMYQQNNATNVYLPKSGATFTGTKYTNGGSTGEGGSSNLTTVNASALLGTTDNGSSLQPYIVVNYIIKAHPSAVNTSEVVNEHSTSETDVYSCNYVNEAIEGTILYNNSSGTNSDITLSDNISNYSTIEFYAINSDDSDESLGIYKFETNKSKFLIQGNNVTSNSFSIFVKEYIIDTNNNKKLNASIGRLYANNQTSNYEVFKITKVIGYK